jgi:PTH1 family peptidyl-tRNA hydrolase
MAWLVNRPQVSDPTNYYSVGQNKSVIIVGLGNPGKEYENTRHNAGFICIDEFVRKTDEMSDWITKKDFKVNISTGRLGEQQVIAIKPTTFMNLSGEAVQKVARFYNIMTSDIVVIHDELDIDFGQIRLRKGGSSAGHNGIKSMSEQVGEDYGRIRIGVGPKHPARIKSEDFVLKKFDEKELEQLPNMKREVISILSEYLYGGGLPIDTRTFIV